MSLNILVVDDSSVVRKMIVRMLGMADIPLGEIHEAANGREGLDVLEKNWVDLVMADLNMPVMTGEEMIGQIRANPAWADIPVVVVSTEGSETRIKKLMENNVRFVHKPFTPEDIRDVINDMIGANRA